MAHVMTTDAAAETFASPNAFALNDDQQAMFDEADRFARNELYPLAERMDNEEWWPEDIFENIGEMGYFGLTVPRRNTADRGWISLSAAWFRKLSDDGTMPWL